MRDRVYQSLHTFYKYNFFIYLFVLLEFTKRKMKQVNAIRYSYRIIFSRTNSISSMRLRQRINSDQITVLTKLAETLYHVIVFCEL